MEFRTKQAIYLQIADYICEQIIRKTWNITDKIPSIRDLAVMVEVNPNTIVRTYTYLEEQGIIFKERGLGYYVAPDGYAKALALKKRLFMQDNLPDLFKNLSLLNMDLAELQTLYNRYRGASHEN